MEGVPGIAHLQPFGATGRLEINLSLQSHSKGDPDSEGTQPDVRDLGSQAGCWGAGIL